MTNKVKYGLNNKKRIEVVVCITDMLIPQVRVMYRNKLKVVIDYPELKGIPIEQVGSICSQKFYGWLDQEYVEM